ncbi:hypothetical protein NUQ40_08140 [Glaesserella parasuis]|nr:hypothetical protein [Glaesserella parasuis]
MHSTAQHSTAQHSTAQHSTAQHSTAHLAENLTTQQADQQAFLNKLDSDLWKAADKLLQQLDAAQ